MPTNQIINNVPPKTQIIATNGQTVFNADWTAASASDVLVYARATGVAADDATQLVSSSDYNVTFVGGSETVRVTFLVGRALDDVITLVRATPAERLNLYGNTNLTPSMLNQDTAILTLVDQERELYNNSVAPRYNVSATIQSPLDVVLPILEENQIWAKNPTNTAFIPYDVPADGRLAPGLAKYLIQTANANLPNAQVMGTLASGFVVNTTATGVQLSRVFTGTANQVDIANGTGIAGNPTASLSATLSAPGTFTVQGTTAVNAIINDDTLATATAQNLATALSLKTYIDNSAGGLVDSVTGTVNQVDIDNTDPQNPVASLSATLSTPGTFTVQGTVAISAIINDNTMATALATNVPTALSIKTYVDSLVGVGPVVSITGTANQVLANGVAGVAQVGAVTLTTPQEIATTSSPTFNNITLTSGTVANAPTVNTDIVNKAYADSIASGFNFVNPVVAASIANFASTYANGASGVGATLTATVNGAFSLDGVSGILNARYLIKNQTNTFENGVYTLTQVGNGGAPAILTRATDFDTPTEIQPGDLVPVLSGTQNISTLWLQTQTVSLVGVDAIVFTQFAALSSFQNTSLTYMLMGG